MYKFLISFVFLFLSVISCCAQEQTFVSLSPAFTEIMYAIGAQEQLLAVSSRCSYPKEAKNKPIIGSLYLINEELLLKMMPNYILAPDMSEFMLAKYKRLGIKPLCYKYKNIDEIYKNIVELGKITNKEENAKKLVENIKNKINTAQKNSLNKNKKIFYIIQEKPLITIGKKSFITDIIEKSGNTSITSDLNTYYPAISEEYAINQNPDIIIADSHCTSIDRIRTLFPKAKIVKLEEYQSDIIDRPGPRIYQSVEFFANIK